jgi:V/A-type H+-transporting ATPase subunit I
LNNIRRNVFANIGAGLWDTYNMATGLMGDLLSYLRLYALGLAGGMLGGVFNTLGMQLRDTLGDFLFGIPGWICFGLIFVAGHGLNIALSCLSGYVHSIRLTFVEYFKNSGYDGKGVEYKPFSSKKKND